MSGFSVLNHLFAGIHKDYHPAVLAGREALIVLIVSHAFHFLELGRRYAAILQIVLYGIGAVLELSCWLRKYHFVGMADDGDIVVGSSFRICASSRREAFASLLSAAELKPKRIPCPQRIL